MIHVCLILCIFALELKKTIMITADQLKDVLEREKALRGYL
jgi:hypothetical protein